DAARGVVALLVGAVDAAELARVGGRGDEDDSLAVRRAVARGSAGEALPGRAARGFGAGAARPFVGVVGPRRRRAAPLLPRIEGLRERDILDADDRVALERRGDDQGAGSIGERSHDVRLPSDIGGVSGEPTSRTSL